LRRALFLAALALVLLAAGWWAYRSYASPEALRGEIQARLSETLATPVELGPVSLRVSPDGIELASEGFRAFPGQGEAALSAARVEVQVDLWAALLGEVRVRGLELTAPTLRLRRREGALEIDAPGGRAALSGLGAQPEVSSRPENAGGESLAWYERLGRALPRLAVSAGRVVVVEGGGPGRDLAVDGLEGTFERRWLRGGIAVEAMGKLSAAGDSAGAFRLEGAFAELPAFRLALEDLDLAAAATLVGARSAGLALRGRATGTLRSEGERLVSVDLRAGRLHLEPILAGRKLPLDLARAAVVASTKAEAGGGERVTGEIRVGSLSVPFDASVSGGALSRARLGPLDLAQLPPLADALREPERSELRRVLDHLRDGRLGELELSWTTGGRLALRARIEAAALAIGRDSRLEELSGEVRYDGDVLEVQSAPARLDGELLPSLDARLAGLAHVRGPSELR
jgi:hypothetical protein